MPENESFSFTILVGGQKIPEYTKDEKIYVESNLTTPVSYKQPQTEFVSGEIEAQEWPVTPYRIEIRASRKMRETEYYFRILVDGVKVKAISLSRGETKVIKGFRDGPILREFLFSMPRFAQDFEDRLAGGRECAIGCIEVQCWEAELRNSRWKMRQKNLDFSQANKKDCTRVTGGEYTMATSKAGKAVAKRSVLRRVDSWRRTTMVSTLKLHYRMGHTLTEMGITLKPFPKSYINNQNVKQEVKKEKDEGYSGIVGSKDGNRVIDLTLDSDSDSDGSDVVVCSVQEATQSQDRETRKRKKKHDARSAEKRRKSEAVHHREEKGNSISDEEDLQKDDSGLGNTVGDSHSHTRTSVLAGSQTTTITRDHAPTDSDSDGVVECTQDQQMSKVTNREQDSPSISAMQTPSLDPEPNKSPIRRKNIGKSGAEPEQPITVSEQEENLDSDSLHNATKERQLISVLDVEEDFIVSDSESILESETETREKSSVSKVVPDSVEESIKSQKEDVSEKRIQESTSNVGSQSEANKEMTASSPKPLDNPAGESDGDSHKSVDGNKLHKKPEGEKTHSKPPTETETETQSQSEVEQKSKSPPLAESSNESERQLKNLPDVTFQSSFLNYVSNKVQETGLKGDMTNEQSVKDDSGSEHKAIDNQSSHDSEEHDKDPRETVSGETPQSADHLD